MRPRLLLAAAVLSAVSLGLVWRSTLSITTIFVPGISTFSPDFSGETSGTFTFNPGTFLPDGEVVAVTGYRDEVRLVVPLLAAALAIAAMRRNRRLAVLAVAGSAAVLVRFLLPEPLTPGKLLFAAALGLAVVALRPSAQAVGAPAGQ